MVTVMRPSRAKVRKCNDTTPWARCPKTVRERVRPALAIVRDESPDRHGLHCPRRDSDRGMVDASRGAEQNAVIRQALVDATAGDPCGKQAARWRAIGPSPSHHCL